MFPLSSNRSWHNLAKYINDAVPVGFYGHNAAYPFCGHLSLNSYNGEKAKPIKFYHVMRGNRSCGVKFLSYPNSGRRETEKVEGNLFKTLWSCAIFPFSGGHAEEGGKILFGRCTLRNPCRHKSWHQVCSTAFSPLSPRPSICALLYYPTEGEIKVQRWVDYPLTARGLREIELVRTESLCWHDKLRICCI